MPMLLVYLTLAMKMEQTEEDFRCFSKVHQVGKGEYFISLPWQYDQHFSLHIPFQSSSLLREDSS